MLRRALMLGSATLAAGALTAHFSARSALAQETDDEPGDSRPKQVASFSGAGFVFRDTISVQSVQDPKVKGVTVYISSAERSLANRLSKDFFGDPTSSSVDVVKTGPIKIVAPIDTTSSGEEVFRAKKNLFFKTQHIRRIYDQENHSLVYVAYTTKVQSKDEDHSSRYRTSVTAINLNADIEVPSK